MALERDPIDPKGLIREAYRIEGITGPECRTIFMDWALSLDEPQSPLIPRLLAQYGESAPDHPMTAVLREGLTEAPPPKRRGGRAGRRA